MNPDYSFSIKRSGKMISESAHEFSRFTAQGIGNKRISELRYIVEEPSAAFASAGDPCGFGMIFRKIPVCHAVETDNDFCIGSAGKKSGKTTVEN